MLGHSSRLGPGLTLIQWVDLQLLGGAPQAGALHLAPAKTSAMERCSAWLWDSRGRPLGGVPPLASAPGGFKVTWQSFQPPSSRPLGPLGPGSGGSGHLGRAALPPPLPQLCPLCSLLWTPCLMSLSAHSAAVPLHVPSPRPPGDKLTLLYLQSLRGF